MPRFFIAVCAAALWLLPRAAGAQQREGEGEAPASQPQDAAASGEAEPHADEPGPPVPLLTGPTRGAHSGAPSERSSMPGARASGPGPASGEPALAPKDGEPGEAKLPRAELGGLPAVAGNNTFGVIMGATGSYTYFDEGYAPFRFRLQLLAITAIKPSPDGPRFPVQDVDLRVDFPGLVGGKLRLYGVMRYLRIEDIGYWGIGNAADGMIPADYQGEDERFHNYRKQLFETRMFARWSLREHWDLVGGVGLRMAWPGIFDDSLLERDLAANGAAAALLYGYTRQVVADGLLGVLYDSRDDEFNPRSGAYHELSVRAGGGPSDDAAIRYGSVYAHGRWFFSLVDERLVLALRSLADVGFGRMPLIEIGTIGGYTSVPGPASIEANRGLPFGRQLGQVKLLETLELRSTFYHFELFAQQLALGWVVFVDASRVWAELARNPLDDGGPALRFSFGTGPRLVWGKGLVIRVDAAASPKGGIDQGPGWAVGLDLGHVF